MAVRTSSAWPWRPLCSGRDRSSWSLQRSARACPAVAGIVEGRPSRRLRRCTSSPPPTSSEAPPRRPRCAAPVGRVRRRARAASATRRRWPTVARAPSTRSVADPHDDGHRPAGRSGRRGLAAARRHRGDRDGGGVGPGARRRRRRQRPDRRHHHGTGELIATAARRRRPTDPRRRRRLGDHRRRPRRRAGHLGVGRLRGRRADRGLRRADPLRRRGRGLRAPEGRDTGPGAAAHPPPRAPGDVYLDDYGVDVPRSTDGGAAGGLAGGLAAVGGDLVSGFDVVADELDLDERIEDADLVVTGEGFLDDESFDGKVVGGVVALAGRRPPRAGRGRARCSTASSPARPGCAWSPWSTAADGTAALEHGPGGHRGGGPAGLTELRRLKPYGGSAAPQWRIPQPISARDRAARPRRARAVAARAVDPPGQSDPGARSLRSSPRRPRRPAGPAG